MGTSRADSQCGHGGVVNPPISTTSAHAPPAVPVMSAEQISALSEGRERFAPIRKAIRYARFDGWAIAVFAVLTGLCGLSSPINLLLGAAMGTIAWVELHEASRLKQAAPGALRRLSYNQLALAGLLILYAIWQLWSGVDPADIQSLKSKVGGDNQTVKLVESMSSLINTLVYGILIIVAVTVQGSTALYYLSREKYLRQYLTQTPGWTKSVVQQD
jgi:hypothetical protein